MEAFEPRLGRDWTISEYTGVVGLSFEDDAVALGTIAKVAVSAQQQPLERLSFSPGLFDADVRLQARIEEWGWELVALDSDRPMHVEVDRWKLTLIPETPVAPGESWALRFDYASPVAVLESSVDAQQALGVSPSSYDGNFQLYAFAELALEQFSQTASTTSYGQDEFYVVFPPWPLPYDCGAADGTDAFPPLDCVARSDVEPSITVALLDGWDAALPSEPTWQEVGGERLAVLDQVPFVMALSPKMAKRVVRIGERDVSLCAPAAHAEALDELEERVRADLPALEQRLGPYPFDAPTVCLSPLRFQHGGLATGRLALVNASVFRTLVGGDDAEVSRGPLRSLDEWIRTAPQFRAEREELVIHELAHHWWQSELPSRWSAVLAEGAATDIAARLLRERYGDSDVGYFVDVGVWAELAELEEMGIRAPRLSEYLHRRTDDWSPVEQTLPYVHGYLAFETMLHDAPAPWEALRAMHRDVPALAGTPNELFADLPGPRKAMAGILARDQTARASGRVNSIELQFRTIWPILRHETSTVGKTSVHVLAAISLREMQNAHLDAAGGLAGAAGVGWLVPASVLAAVGADEDCLDAPSSPRVRARCEDVLHREGPGMLMATMDMAALDEWLRVQDDDDWTWETYARERATDGAAEAAQRLAAEPIGVTAAEAARVEGEFPDGLGRAGLLYARIHANWAARAYLHLFSE